MLSTHEIAAHNIGKWSGPHKSMGENKNMQKYYACHQDSAVSCLLETTGKWLREGPNKS